MNEFYVYLHKKADTGEVFYVGKGKGNRAYQKGTRRSEYWNRVANKHGFTVEIIVDGLCEESAFEYECFKIKELREKGYVLVNLTEGGEGCSGRVPSKETRKKISEANSGEKNPMFGKLGEYAPNFGRKHSDEAKLKMSKAHLGEKNHAFGKTGEKCKTSKPVLQFYKDGSFIKEWSCAMEVERVLKIDHSGIAKCCKGRLKSAGGYLWKYKE